MMKINLKRIASLLVAVFVVACSVVPVFAVESCDMDSEAFADYLDSLSGVSTFAARAADGIGPVFISGFSSSTSYTDTTKTISYRSGIYGNYRILDFSNYSTSYYSTNSLTSSGNGSQKTFYADFLKSVDYPGSDKNYYFYVADIESDVVSGKLSIPVSFSAPSSLSYTFTGSIKFLDSSGTEISRKSFSMVSGTGSYNNTLSVSFDWPEDTVYYVKIYIGNLVGAYSSSQSVTFSANNFTLSLTEPYTPETQPTDPPDPGGDSGDSGDDSGSSGTGGSIDTSGIEDRLDSVNDNLTAVGDRIDQSISDSTAAIQDGISQSTAQIQDSLGAVESQISASNEKLDTIIGNGSEGDYLQFGAVGMGLYKERFQQFEEEQQAIFDNSFGEINAKLTFTKFTSALAFVQNYLNFAFAGFEDYMIVYYLPFYLGIFFFLCMRIPGITRWRERAPVQRDSSST